MRFSKSKLVCVFAMVSAFYAVVLVVFARTGIRLADAEKIKIGMSLPDVVSTIGQRTGDMPNAWTFEKMDRWEASDGYIYIAFDSNQFVSNVATETVSRCERIQNTALRIIGMRSEPVFLFPTQLSLPFGASPD